MIQNPMDILQDFPVRKTKKQKQRFRDAVVSYAESFGYPVYVESGYLGSHNVVIGNPDTADYLVTAHYDTPVTMLFPNRITPTNPVTFVLYRILLAFFLIIFPLCIAFLLCLAVFAVGAFCLPEQDGAQIVVIVMMVWYVSSFLLYLLEFALVYFGPANNNNANDNTSGVVTLLEIAGTLPENQRHKACFVLFDLEEAGMIGSSSYRKAHKDATDHQLVLNLDCVGDGDHILMLPTKQLKKDRKMLTSLYKACGYFGKKCILLKETGFSVYPSDQRSFPYGVGICALNKGKYGLYLSRIHTSKDTILDITNVNILRAAITSFICCNAANRKEETK